MARKTAAEFNTEARAAVLADVQRWRGRLDFYGDPLSPTKARHALLEEFSNGGRDRLTAAGLDSRKYFEFASSLPYAIGWTWAEFDAWAATGEAPAWVAEEERKSAARKAAAEKERRAEAARKLSDARLPSKRSGAFGDYFITWDRGPLGVAARDQVRVTATARTAPPYIADAVRAFAEELGKRNREFSAQFSDVRVSSADGGRVWTYVRRRSESAADPVLRWADVEAAARVAFGAKASKPAARDLVVDTADAYASALEAHDAARLPYSDATEQGRRAAVVRRSLKAYEEQPTRGAAAGLAESMRETWAPELAGTYDAAQSAIRDRATGGTKATPRRAKSGAEGGRTPPPATSETPSPSRAVGAPARRGEQLALFGAGETTSGKVARLLGGR